MSEDRESSFGKNSFSAKNSSERGYKPSSRRKDDEEPVRRRSRSPKDHRSGSRRRSGSPPPPSAERRRDRSRERDRYDSRPRQYDRNERRGRDYDNRRERRRGDDYEDRRQDDGDKDRPSWENSKVRRHADKIQQRKLLWSKAKEDGNSAEAESGGGDGQSPQTSAASGGSAAPKVLESAWTSRLAAATTDSKQIDKFQRLMGIKKSAEDAKPVSAECAEGSSNVGGGVDKTFLEKERQRQAELTAQLDKQYAMARASTHLGRGKGLGFNG